MLIYFLLYKISHAPPLLLNVCIHLTFYLLFFSLMLHSILLDCDVLVLGVMVVGATNVPDALDESLIAGRLPMLEVPPPDRADRLAIFTAATARMPLASDVR